MSENWLRLIPTAPDWVPDRVAEARAKATLRKQAPKAHDLSTETFAEITFVDCGGNFQGIYCPHCDAEVPITWWQKAMNAAQESGFLSLQVTMPCCGGSASLNDLRYDWPMGFARWELVAFSPERMELDEIEMQELENAVGHGLRQIWTHI